MPGRQYNAATGYRYGFNGKEKDNKDGVVQYDYGFRIYDPRLVRFKSVDPLSQSYPWNSPYSYAEGDVIRCIDIDGLEKLTATINKDKFGRIKSMTIEGIRDIDVKNGVDVNLKFANKRDVTTRDVLIITKQEGKSDQLSFDDLNQSYRNQIKKAPTAESEGENNSITIPDGADGAIQQTAISYNNSYLQGAASYDDQKYEFFYSDQKFNLSKPIEKKDGALLTSSNDRSPEYNGQALVNFLKNTQNDFNITHSGLSKQIIEISIMGKSQANTNMEAVKKLLNKDYPNAIIKIKINEKYDHVKNGGDSVSSQGTAYSQDEINKSYRVDIKISGVK